MIIQPNTIGLDTREHKGGITDQRLGVVNGNRVRVFGALRLVAIVQDEVRLAIVHDRWLKGRKHWKREPLDPKYGQDRTTEMM